MALRRSADTRCSKAEHGEQPGSAPRARSGISGPAVGPIAIRALKSLGGSIASASTADCGLLSRAGRGREPRILIQVRPAFGRSLEELGYSARFAIATAASPNRRADIANDAQVNRRSRGWRGTGSSTSRPSDFHHCRSCPRPRSKVRQGVTTRHRPLRILGSRGAAGKVALLRDFENERTVAPLKETTFRLTSADFPRPRSRRMPSAQHAAG